MRIRSKIWAAGAALTLAVTGTGLTAVAGTAAEPAKGEAAKGEAVSALAKARASGKPVEIESRRSATTKVLANPSGTLTVDQYLSTVHVRRGGAWVDVDTRLAIGPKGTVVPKAAALGLEFSAGGKGPLVTMRKNQHELGLTWPGTLPKPRLDGAVATYPEVFAGVDLQVRAEAEGFAQLLVVKDAKAAKNPALRKVAFGLSADGLKVSSDPARGLKAVDGKGKTVFSGPVPEMWDSSRAARGAKAAAGKGSQAVKGAKGAAVKGAPAAKGVLAVKGAPASQGAESAKAAQAPKVAAPGSERGFTPNEGAKRARMRTEVSGKTLAVSPDQKLLTAADTTYPVYIDPWFTGATLAFVGVDSHTPDTPDWNDQWGGASTGRTMEGDIWGDPATWVWYTLRSFFRMDTANLAGRKVLNSTFLIKNTYAWGCETHAVELWKTGAVSPETTWNTQPDWTTKLDSMTAAKGGNPDCPEGELGFNATAAVSEAATAKAPTVTLGLKAAPEAETDVYSLRSWTGHSARLSTETTYGGECFLIDGARHTDPDGNSFTKEMSCENQASDLRVEPYADAPLTGRLLAGPHGFVCWRSGDVNGAGNRIWYYVRGDESAGWTAWGGWGYVPADKIIGAGSVPFPGLPACNVHTVTPGLFAPQDFNSDGHADIAVHLADGNVALHRGNGNGTLGQKSSMWTDGRANAYKQTFAGDFNGDGIGDLAAAASDGGLWWWPGNGDGGVTGAAQQIASEYSTFYDDFSVCRDFFSGDFDSDGNSELAALCPTDIDATEDALVVWHNNGDGTFAWSGEELGIGGMDGMNGYHDMMSGDFNSDGRADVAGISPEGNVHWWVGNGNESFSGVVHGNPELWPDTTFSTTYSQPFSGDFNGDRRSDIAALDASGVLWWWAGEGDGRLSTTAKQLSTDPALKTAKQIV
ncbi:FG-GAP-like repeat-containing protein [Streptomyces ficellus]|uniref:FG-GAP-like repeat-containing protein n=1 Tax=Streptomyces ficellus TaxID=1977088 RepID=A0ABT7ZC33_9ACTN|nr:FG-GAP-like repeat-containing protein [Streptomyces ficellus]MDN3297054.1 FG-GAP-like repeat-containing protein [Streptomyces ficellus]